MTKIVKQVGKIYEKLSKTTGKSQEEMLIASNLLIAQKLEEQTKQGKKLLKYYKKQLK